MSFTCAFSALVSAKTEKCCLLNCELRGKDPPGLEVSIMPLVWEVWRTVVLTDGLLTALTLLIQHLFVLCKKLQPLTFSLSGSAHTTRDQTFQMEHAGRQRKERKW